MGYLLPRKSLPPDEQVGFIDKRTGKPKRITPRLKKVIRLLLAGDCKTLKAASAQAGITPEHLSRALRQPHVQQYVDTETRTCLATGKLAASARLLELVHATSEHVAFDASAHMLGIAGIRPVGDAAVAVNVNVSPGYCIDLQTDPREAMAPNHPLRTIENHHRGEFASRPEPASGSNQNLAPTPKFESLPFHGLVQSEKQKDDR